MKMKFTIALIAAMTLLVGCNKELDTEECTSPTADQIIEIKGLKWTTGNLVAVAGKTDRCKVGAPTDGGLYFQFGSLIGWSGGASGDGTGIGSPALAISAKPSAYAGSIDYTACGYYSTGTSGGLPSTDDAETGVGDPCRFYLGSPWRTPTGAEFASMCNNAANNATLAAANAAWQASPIGMNFNDNVTKLFIPASGYRNYSAGAIYNVGTLGSYWSESVFDSVYGSSLYFGNGAVYPQGNNYRRHGFLVRCVAGEMFVEPTVPMLPTADQIIEINGLKWTTGNLVAVNATNAKVGAPTDGGLYFQFGSLIGWSGGASGDGTGIGSPALTINAKPSTYTGPIEWATCGYYSTGASGGLPSTDDAATGIGDPCRFYLGGEWRTPTEAEFASMCNNAVNNSTLAAANAAWQASPIGMNFNDNGTKLFIPASGYRNYSAGAIYNVGTLGSYWSESVSNSSVGYGLNFHYSGVYPQNYYHRRGGFPVRCVQ